MWINDRTNVRPELDEIVFVWRRICSASKPVRPSPLAIPTPGAGDSLISKADPSEGEALACHFGRVDACDYPKCG